jgi:hypothetical protein
MNIRNLRTSVTAALVAAALALSVPAAPAKANTTSTLLIGAAAAAVALTAINVTNKNNKANAVAGRLPNGDTAYADGHVITRSGSKYYPGDHGQTLECANQRCRVAGTNGMYNGHKYAYTRH